MEIRAGHYSDKGPRANNQDMARVNVERAYATVADGMGGAAGGAEASRMAVELTDWLMQSEVASARQQATVPALLARVFAEANRWVLQRSENTPGLRGMGTTLVVLLVSDGRYHVGHAGDSRAYLLRRGELVQLTKDHSLVQTRVDAGLVLPEDAHKQPDRNVITRAVGVHEEVEPTISEGELMDGDTFVLTTDGVHGVVPASRIRELASIDPPQAAAESLVREALALRTTDNSTAAVFRVGQTSPEFPSEAPTGQQEPIGLSILKRLKELYR